MVWRSAPDPADGHPSTLGMSSKHLSGGLGHSQSDAFRSVRDFHSQGVHAGGRVRVRPGHCGRAWYVFYAGFDHTSQTADGRIIARNIPLPTPPNATGDRGYPLTYSDWPYETVFKHGNHLRIVDAAFILREHKLSEALGIRRCRAFPRDLDNWSRDVTTFLRYHVGRSPTDKGDRKHPERNGVGLSLDMGGWLSIDDFAYWWMCSKDARFHCGRHGGGRLYRLDEANWRKYALEGPADPTNLLALMIRDCHNDRFKLRLQICCEFSGPLPSENDRMGVSWDGHLPTRIAGIRVLLN